MNYDIKASLKRTKADRFDHGLGRSSDDRLLFVQDIADVGGPIMLDTCAVLDGLRGKAPAKLKDLLEVRQVYHSSVVLSELARPFGHLDPKHSGTKSALAPIRNILDAVKSYRVIDADANLLTEASIRVGIVARHLGLPIEDRGRLFNDAIIAAQAASHGVLLITANKRDFDLLAQLDPRLTVAFYAVAQAGTATAAH